MMTGILIFIVLVVAGVVIYAKKYGACEHEWEPDADHRTAVCGKCGAVGQRQHPGIW